MQQAHMIWPSHPIVTHNLTFPSNQLFIAVHVCVNNIHEKAFVWRGFMCNSKQNKMVEGWVMQDLEIFFLKHTGQEKCSLSSTCLYLQISFTVSVVDACLQLLLFFCVCVFFVSITCIISYLMPAPVCWGRYIVICAKSHIRFSACHIFGDK